MFANVKRVLALVMVLAMVVAFIPAISASATSLPNPLDEERRVVKNWGEVTEKYVPGQKGGAPIAEEIPTKAYNTVEAVFDALDELENKPATKDLNEEAFTEKVVEIVTASSCYKADSVEVNGSTVIWWTTDGIRCMYSPRFEKIEENFIPENSIDEIVNEPSMLTKGGQPSSREVYLIGPYYGIDSNFTNQYKNEAARIAKAIGDTDGYTLFSGRKVTIDKVAEAVSNGAVVLYDSHGATDYTSGNDSVSFANYSYLCLNNTTGLTTADYSAGASYGGDGTAFVNGQAIANHMTKNSPGGISWFATCLSMATNTLCNPLRSKGVEVVYGYSQSVTFIGEYEFEESFWDAFLKQGTSVKQAITAMKNKCGNWDLAVPMVVNMGYPASEGYATISEARADYCAFPIVVSDEDSHPGQRYLTSNWGADIVQTVKSTYTLGSLPGNGNPNQSGSGTGTTPSGNYHQQLLEYIRTNGRYDSSQGVYWIGKELESTNYNFYYYLSDLDGQIWMEGHIIAKYYEDFDISTNVYLTDGSDTFDLETTITYYPNSSYYEDYPVSGYDYRKNFTKDTYYDLNGSDGYYISTSDAEQLFNVGLQDMFLELDPFMYDNVSFGVKCLGFINYDGYGPDPAPAAIPGDMNGDNTVNNDDVILMMWHNLFPDQYPMTVNTDINHDGTVNNDDVILLMWHNLFPENYPLS